MRKTEQSLFFEYLVQTSSLMTKVNDGAVACHSKVVVAVWAGGKKVPVCKHHIVAELIAMSVCNCKLILFFFSSASLGW